MRSMLDLGAVVGRVVLEDVEFQRTYVRIVRQFSSLGAEAEKGAAGTGALDEALAAVGKSGSAAAAGIGRSTKATGEESIAARRAAQAEQARATAISRVAAVMAPLADATAKEQQATLRDVAAQERLTAVRQGASTEAGRQASATARVAAAQASAIASTDRLAASQRTLATATVAERSAFAGLLRTGAELGLVIGGIEIAKKASEFVMAGRDLTTSLNSVQAAAQATDAQMVPVRAQVIGLGKDLTIPRATAIDAAEAIDDLVRSGMTLPRAMASARSALLLASVSQTDMALSARVLGDALDEFRMPASKAADVANMLGAAATATSGGLQTVFDALRYAGTRARAANIPMEDLLASIVDLSKAGLQGTNIGTGLAMAIGKLAAPSGPGAKALKDLGIAAFDTSGKFKGLPYVIEQVFAAQKRLGAGSQKFLQDVTVAFGSRAANAMAGFAGKGIEGLDRFETRLKSFNLQTAANQMNRGLAAAFAQDRKELTALGIDVYSKVGPALTSAMMWIGTDLPHALSVLGDILGPTTHMVGTGFAGAWHVALAVLGPVAGALGTVGNVLSEHSGLISHVIAPLLAMWAAWKGYTIARAAVFAVQDAIAVMGTRLTNSVAGFQAWQAGSTESMRGVSLQLQTEAALMQAEFARIEAADLELTATISRSAAVQAASFARMTQASEYSSAAQVAAAQRASAAAEEQAVAAEAAAATAVASADAAAAGIDEAGAVAAVGWKALLGPVALVATGIAMVATMFGHSSSAADEAAKSVDGYTTAIQDDSNALGDNTRAQVKHNLMQANAYQNALKLGIGQGTLTDAVMGNKTALAQVNDALAAHKNGTEQDKLAVLLVAGALGIQSSALKTGRRDARDMAAADTTAAGAARNHGKAVHDLVQPLRWVIDAGGNLVQTNAKVAGASAAATTALQAQTVASQNLKTAEDLLNGVNVSLENATDSLSIGLGNLRSKQSLATDASGHATASLKQNTVAGATNRQMLAGLIENAKAQAQATADQAAKHHTLGQALIIGNAQLAKNEDRLRAAAAAAGMNKGDVDKLIASLGILSKVHPKPKVDADTTTATKKTNDVFSRLHMLDVSRANATVGINDQASGPLNAIIGKLVRIGQGASANVIVHTSTGVVHVDSSHAAGGSPSRGSSFTVGERGWELGHLDKSGNLSIVPHAQSMAMTGLPDTLPGFAAGTGSNPDLTRAISVIRAILSAATRPESTTVAGIRGAFEWNAHNAVAKRVETEKAWTNYAKARDAASAYAAAVNKIPATQEKARAAAQKTADAAQKAADKAHDAWSRLNDQANTAAQNAADKAQALVQKLNDVQAAFASKVGDFRSAISSGISGGVSLTSLWSDTGGDAATMQRRADVLLAASKRFAGDLKHLASLGVSPMELQQIAGLGSESGDALAKQLIALGPARLKALNASLDAIQNVGGSTAATLAHGFYGAGATSMANMLKGIEAKYPSLVSALRPIVARISSMFHFTPVVTAPHYSGSGTAGKHYAAGGKNILGGYALVGEHGPEYAWLPPHSNVYSHGVTPPGPDWSPVVDRLEAIERRLASIDDNAPGRMADAGAGLFREAGRSQARELERIGRQYR